MRSAALLSVAMVALMMGAAVPALPVEPASPNRLLAEMAFEGGTDSDPCPGAVNTRSYEVVALALPVSYNNWGDFDPFGRVLVPAEHEAEAVQQVAERLADAGLESLLRVAGNPAGIIQELGLLSKEFPKLDPFQPSPLVQPFVARARMGECVELTLTNKLPEPVGLHIRKVEARPGQGSALGSAEEDLTLPGQTRTYTVFVPNVPGMEGAHLLQSRSDVRYHTKHGLFGALVVEPPDASWRAPDGSASDFGQEAIITRPGASDYREFVLLMHDEVELYDRSLNPLPPLAPDGEYGPGSKAINLRTEPFMDRFEHHQDLFEQGLVARNKDKSQGYGSYTYGDPGVFIPRAYVGDPTKIRLVNPGPGQHHVFHLHGGGDRWRASPVSDDTQFDRGLIKNNDIERSRSERLDVQNIGPGESFNLEIEGGAGGVQQSVGDFLYHCHIVEHYLAGMWAFWRVFNTLQPGLAELPDRAGGTPAAVDSTGLLGRTMPDGTVLTPANLASWVEAQLPDQGVPDDDEATVWDWTVESTADGPLYKGEPEDTIAWPNYESPTPGERPVLEFHPDNGRLSYPFLKPHFGKRPPFAPNHGPAPYLGLTADQGRPDGLCPSGARPLDYKVVATSTPVVFNDADTDPDGMVFTLAQHKDDVLAGTRDAQNLIIRANVGDCVDVLLTSQLRQNPGEHSKVNMHIHLIQFDVQASDGVITGSNYEQSVRPAGAADTTLLDAAPAGATEIRVAHPDRVTVGTFLWIGAGAGAVERVEVSHFDFADPNKVVLITSLSSAHAAGERVQPEATGTMLDAPAQAGDTTVQVADGSTLREGVEVGIGLTTSGVEFRRIVSVSGNTVTLDAPLDQTHEAGERMGHEYVRYRWYIDAEVGTVYWHDHVDGLKSWKHGLFGTLLVEPRGSEWRDPKTGLHVEAGPLADIIGPQDTFREVALVFQDRTEVVNGRNLSTFNLRSAPFDNRAAGNPLSSDHGHGDPSTTMLEAYPGDPVRIRLLYGANVNTRAVGTFGLAGHRFAFEQHNPGSRVIDAASFGISSQHNFLLDGGAGGPARMPGDYLYYMTQPENFGQGAWGIFRVHAAPDPGLLTLPTNPTPSPGSLPPGPTRAYDVVAMEAEVTYNAEEGLSRTESIFALASEKADIDSGALNPQPLVLRALPGEWVEVTLTNHLDEPVSLHAGMLLADPLTGDMGVPVGDNPDASVAPGDTRTYRWFADTELGVVQLRSFADPAKYVEDALYGALVVEPTGSSFTPATGTRADLTLSDGTAVREHVLVYASNDPVFEGSVMPYHVDVHDIAAVNYRTENLNHRLGQLPSLNQGGEPLGGMGLHPCQLNSDSCRTAIPGLGKELLYEVRHPLAPWVYSSGLHGDPETPILDAAQGQRVVVRAVGGAGDQLAVHTIAGHWWAKDPGMVGSDLVDAVTLGTRETSNGWFTAGPGGAGDYLWSNGRVAFTEAGAWGILRVE